MNAAAISATTAAPAPILMARLPGPKIGATASRSALRIFIGQGRSDACLRSIKGPSNAPMFSHRVNSLRASCSVRLRSNIIAPTALPFFTSSTVQIACAPWRWASVVCARSTRGCAPSGCGNSSVEPCQIVSSMAAPISRSRPWLALNSVL